jgi:WD40 repeat protein
MGVTMRKSINPITQGFCIVLFFRQFVAPALADEPIVLSSHTKHVTSIAFSSDSNRLVTASLDHSVKVWRLPKGDVESFTHDEQDVMAAEFSPDGKLIASCSASGKVGVVKVWDATSGKVKYTLEGHRPFAVTAVFTPDGKRLVTADSAGAVIQWDMETGKAISEFGVNNGGNIGPMLRRAQLSPDGKMIASCGQQAIPTLWDPATGKEILRLKIDAKSHDIAFSPDGRHVAVAGVQPPDESDGVGTIRICDCNSGKETLGLKLPESYRVTDVTWSPDGNFIAYSMKPCKDPHIRYNDRYFVRIADAKTGDVVASLDDYQKLPNGGDNGQTAPIAFSPDGKWIATATGAQDDDKHFIVCVRELAKVLEAKK